MDNTHYYYETGIWDFWLDCQGNPEILARNDDTGDLMLLSFKKKGQEERKFPLKQNKNTDHKNFFPYKYEDMEGYFSYQGNVIKIYDNNGNERKNVKLNSCFNKFEKEINQEAADKNKERKKYEVEQVDQIKNGNLCFVIRTWTENILQTYDRYRKKSDWDGFYLLEIDIKKEKIVSIEKNDNWILGSDENYVFAFRGEFPSDNRMFSREDFQDGYLEISDRKQGDVIKRLKIPNDIEDDYGSRPSQQFDFHDGILYFANRSGVYALSGKEEGWKQLVKPENTLYINKNYFIADFKVKNEKCFYILFVAGLDDESAGLLVKYELL